MNKDSKMLLLLLLVATIAVAAIACYPSDKEATPSKITCTVTDIDGFGSYSTSLFADDMVDNGYRHGDIVSLKVMGYEFKAIYLVEYSGALPFELVLSYPSDTRCITLTLFDCCLCVLMPLEEGTPITIEYLHHGDRESQYPEFINGVDKEIIPGQLLSEFVNFRVIELGGLDLIRSSNPMHPDALGKDRSYACDELFACVDRVIDLGDTEKSLEERLSVARGKGICEKMIELYDYGKVEAMFCHADFILSADDYKRVFLSISEHGSDEQMAIMCKLGKDRTGTVFMVLEALAGWSVDDIAEDFCASYVHLYGVNPDSDEYRNIERNEFGRVFYMFAYPEELENMLSIDWEHIDYKSIDAKKAAENYLLNYVGLTQGELDQLEKLVTGNNEGI